MENVVHQILQKLVSYVSLVLDEKYVQEGLYFDKHTGVLVGFADLGEKKQYSFTLRTAF